MFNTSTRCLRCQTPVAASNVVVYLAKCMHMHAMLSSAHPTLTHRATVDARAARSAGFELGRGLHEHFPFRKNALRTLR